jgi:twitching motility protein PilU
MIGHRNANSRGHIITIEDPIEFLHQHQGCVVSQREVGLDTESFRSRAEEYAASGAGRDPDR